MPLEVTVARRGDAVFPRGKTDVAELRRLPEGRMVKCRFDLPRSGKDHCTFFRVIDLVFHNWPAEKAEFDPRDSEHLRAWLLAKAGHYEAKDFEPHSEDPREAAWEFALFLGGFVGRRDFFVKGTANGLRVFIPRSIAYGELDQKDFAEVRTKVAEIIEAITGVSYEKWKNGEVS